MIANADVAAAATRHCFGKYFSRHMLNGINQPNTYPVVSNAHYQASSRSAEERVSHQQTKEAGIPSV